MPCIFMPCYLVRHFHVLQFHVRHFQSTQWYINHDVYGSTSCCISHEPSQCQMAMFDRHSSKTPQPIFLKLEIHNYTSRTRARMDWRSMVNSSRPNSGMLCHIYLKLGRQSSMVHTAACLSTIASPRVCRVLAREDRGQRVWPTTAMASGGHSAWSRPSSTEFRHRRWSVKPVFRRESC